MAMVILHKCLSGQASLHVCQLLFFLLTISFPKEEEGIGKHCGLQVVHEKQTTPGFLGFHHHYQAVLTVIQICSQKTFHHQLIKQIPLSGPAFSCWVFNYRFLLLGTVDPVSPPHTKTIPEYATNLLLHYTMLLLQVYSQKTDVLLSHQVS